MKRSAEKLLQDIRVLAEAGATTAQAAEKLGYSYQYISRLSRESGISFSRQYLINSNTNARNQEICKRYLDGEMQVRLADEFGITRERVRQIIEKAGLVSEGQRHADFVAVVVGTVERKQLTVSQAADMFKISKQVAYNYCRSQGVKFASMTAEEAAELDALARAVVDGESCRKVVGGSDKKAAKLIRHLERKGITARGRSRHDDFSKRKELIENWRAEGLSWSECAIKLTAHDGRHISYNGVYMWVRKNMPHLIESVAA